ncbi:unnamed protein product [marine sediment metagenome]|uniref:Uncharacterized protein n=1 Tax=marine sediment metagenome TaxID=412755 RepID=X1AZG5_9ZZZZ
MKKWISKANWKKYNPGHASNNENRIIEHITSDYHETKSQAEAVCRLLLCDYSHDSPCDIRGTCYKAWVEKA